MLVVSMRFIESVHMEIGAFHSSVFGLTSRVEGSLYCSRPHASDDTILFSLLHIWIYDLTAFRDSDIDCICTSKSRLRNPKAEQMSRFPLNLSSWLPSTERGTQTTAFIQ